MHGALLAVVHPDNTPHGANLTFAVPVLVFVITSGVLYLRFRAAHTVPGHVPLGSSRWVTAGDAAVGAPQEPVATATPDAPAGATAAAGTVQSDATGPGANDTAGTGSEQGKPASEGTEDGE